MRDTAFMEVEIEGTKFFFRTLRLNEQLDFKEKGLGGVFSLLSKVEGEPVDVDGRVFTLEEMQAGELPSRVAARISRALAEVSAAETERITGKKEETLEKK